MDRGAEKVLCLGVVDPVRFRCLLRDFFLVILQPPRGVMRSDQQLYA